MTYLLMIHNNFLGSIASRLSVNKRVVQPKIIEEKDMKDKKKTKKEKKNRKKNKEKAVNLEEKKKIEREKNDIKNEWKKIDEEKAGLQSNKRNFDEPNFAHSSLDLSTDLERFRFLLFCSLSSSFLI